MAFNRMIQSKEESLLRAVESDPKAVQGILELNETMEKFALSLTKSNGLLIRAISGENGLKPTVEKLIATMEQVGEDPMGFLKDLLNPF